MAANPQDAAELKETLSEKEEAFEKWRNTMVCFWGRLWRWRYI